MKKENMLAAMMFGGGGGGGGEGEPFVVELTPTALDLRAGTMNKTVGEITAVWREGRKIAFRITVPGLGGHCIFLNDTGFSKGFEYPSFNFLFITDMGLGYKMGAIFTEVTNDPDKITWSLVPFDLTPAT